MITLNRTDKKLTITVTQSSSSNASEISLSNAIKWIQETLLPDLTQHNYQLEELDVKLTTNITQKEVIGLVQTLAEAVREIELKTSKKLKIISTSELHINTKLFNQVSNPNQTSISVSLNGENHWEHSARDFTSFALETYGIQRIDLTGMDGKYFDSNDRKFRENKIAIGTYILPKVDQLSCDFDNSSVPLRVVNQALSTFTPSAEVIYFKCKVLADLYTDSSIPDFCTEVDKRKNTIIIISANRFENSTDFFKIITALDRLDSIVIFNDAADVNESVFHLLERMSQLNTMNQGELPSFIQDALYRENYNAFKVRQYYKKVAQKAREKLDELRKKAFAWDDNPNERLFQMIANASYTFEEIKKDIETKNYSEYQLKTLIDQNGYGIVHYAARYGRLDLLQYLDHLFIPLNSINQSNGNNALHLATYFDQKEVVDYLTKRKEFDLSESNIWGDTAFMIILQKYSLTAGFGDIPEVLKRAISDEIGKLLESSPVLKTDEYVKQFGFAPEPIKNFIKAILLAKYNQLAMDFAKNIDTLINLALILEKHYNLQFLPIKNETDGLKLQEAISLLTGGASSSSQNSSMTSIAEAILSGLIIFNGKLSNAAFNTSTVSADDQSVIKRCAHALAFLQGVESKDAEKFISSIEKTLCRLSGDENKSEWSADILKLVQRELAILDFPFPSLVKMRMGIKNTTVVPANANPVFDIIKAKEDLDAKIKELLEAPTKASEAAKEKSRKANEEILKLKSEISVLKAEKEKLIKEKEGKDKTLAFLEEETDAIKKQKSEFEAKLEEIRFQIESLKTEVASKETSLQSVIKLHTETCARLEAEYSELQTKKSTLIQKEAALKQMITKLLQDKPQHEQQYKMYEGKMKEAQAALAAKRSELAKFAEMETLMNEKKIKILFIGALKRAYLAFAEANPKLNSALDDFIPQLSNLIDVGSTTRQTHIRIDSVLLALKEKLISLSDSIANKFVAYILNEICKKQGDIKLAISLNPYLQGELPTDIEPNDKVNYTNNTKQMQTLCTRAFKAFKNYQPTIVLKLERLQIGSPVSPASTFAAPATGSQIPENPFYATNPHSGSMYAPSTPPHRGGQGQLYDASAFRMDK
ncbi:MAG: ankyrin repeat domain-containing protein [Gammaproteobacteria bacterium]